MRALETFILVVYFRESKHLVWRAIFAAHLMTFERHNSVFTLYENESFDFIWASSSLHPIVTMSDSVPAVESTVDPIAHRRDDIRNLASKVTVLEQKLDQFHTVSLERFDQIRALIVRLPNLPGEQASSINNATDDSDGTNRNRQPSVSPEMAERQIDEADRLNRNAYDAPSDALLQHMEPANGVPIVHIDESIEADKEYEAIFESKPLVATSSHRESPQFQRKLPRHFSRDDRSKTPYRPIPNYLAGQPHKLTEEYTKATCNVLFTTVCVIFVIVFSITLIFVCEGGNEGLAIIETVAELSIDYMEKCKEIVVQLLFDQDKRFHTVDPHDLHNKIAQK